MGRVAITEPVIEDGGRPTYSTNFLTNFIPLNPSGANAAKPNPVANARREIKP